MKTKISYTELTKVLESIKHSPIIHKSSVFSPNPATAGTLCTALAKRSPFFNVISNYSSKKVLQLRPEFYHNGFYRFYSIPQQKPVLNLDGITLPRTTPALNRGRFYSSKESDTKEDGSEWPILKRWDVPWKWQMFSLTSLACELGFYWPELFKPAGFPYLGHQIEELTLDAKAEILFVDQAITTAVVFAVLYGTCKSYGPLTNDVFRYDYREPFNFQKGWVLWAGIGLVGTIIASVLTDATISFFSSDNPKREHTGDLVRLLPLIGSSTISTAYLVGRICILGPVLEETLYRGFLMVSLTQWLPTPVSILLSAAVFAIAHLDPGKFPQLFTLGAAFGLSYAQTRNLLTPIIVHALWNFIVILTYLPLVQGYDIKKIILGS